MGVYDSSTIFKNNITVPVQERLLQAPAKDFCNMVADLMMRFPSATIGACLDISLQAYGSMFLCSNKKTPANSSVLAWKQTSCARMRSLTESFRSMIGGRPLLVKFAYPSERLLKLSEPKKFHPAFVQPRDPHWPVSLSALTYDASPRILELARPKSLHPAFVPPREVPTQVPIPATKASASARIERLAEPCVRQVTCCYKHSYPESGIRPISKSAQQAVASPRTIELARPKKVHSKYAAPRNPEWPVSEAAKRAVATPRIVELAQPGKRPPMGLAQFNVDAFRVKETAMKATCSDRIRELARPIQR